MKSYDVLEFMRMLDNEYLAKAIKRQKRKYYRCKRKAERYINRLLLKAPNKQYQDIDNSTSDI